LQLVTNQATARIGVVGGDSLRSLGLVAILEEIAGVVASPLERAEIFGTDEFNLLLLDMREPVETILQVITRLRSERPTVKAIVMGDPLSLDQIQSLIGAGAKGFMLQTAGVSEIRMAVEIVMDGSMWAPRKVLASLVEAGTARNTVMGPRAGTNQPIAEMLTERERDVLHLLMSGRSNREIAAAMGIEQATVKAHLGRMLRKTRAHNRVELTLRAMEELGEGAEPDILGY
jgi:DNA-binding NarL/FixJ family response regulator